MISPFFQWVQVFEYFTDLGLIDLILISLNANAPCNYSHTTKPGLALLWAARAFVTISLSQQVCLSGQSETRSEVSRFEDRHRGDTIDGSRGPCCR